MTGRWRQLTVVAQGIGWVIAATLGMGSASCPKDLALTVDPRFSVNLVRPAETWPRFKHLTPGEIDAYEAYGRPDYFRIWYNPKGDIATSLEAGSAIRRKRLKELPRSWVYEAKKIEIQFQSVARYLEVPLSDRLQVLCLRGDPQERDVQPRSGMIRESWTYFDVGEKYFFLDGHLAEKQVFPGVGKPFLRM